MWQKSSLSRLLIQQWLLYADSCRRCASNPDGVSADFLKSGNFEVEVACERHGAHLQLGAFYDPKNERIKQ